MQAELNSELNLIRQMTSALAQAVNLTSESERLVEDLGNDVDLYMKDQLVAFRATLETFRARRQALEALLQQTIEASRGSVSQERVAEVRTFRAKAQTLQQDIERLSKEIRTQEEQISNSLDDARLKHLQDRFTTQRVRRALVGLQAELERLLAPAAVGSLQWVEEEAWALRNELNQHNESSVSQIDDQYLKACRYRLDELIRRSKELDQQDMQRRWIAAKVAQAIQDSGFLLIWNEESDDRHAPVRYQHGQGQEGTVTIHTTVPMTGPLTFWMVSPSGQDTLAYSSAPSCPSDLQRVIDRARILGVEITDVLVKGPNGNWNYLLRGDEVTEEWEEGTKGKDYMQSQYPQQ
jgi:hypothetical protein